MLAMRHLISFQLILNSIINAKSIEEKIGSKYEFLLFENFQKTAEVYINEARMVTTLESLKQQLTDSITKLKAAREITNGKMNHILILNDIVSEIASNHRKILKSLYKIKNDLPSKQDYEGSKKGLLTLFYAYEFNITHAIQDRGLQMTDEFGMQR